MEGFISTGEEWMLPLAEFRTNLIVYRDADGMRSTFKRDGTKGAGPFKPDARKRILRELLETEKKAGWELISAEELTSIQKIWNAEFDYTHGEVASIAKDFNRTLSADYFAHPDEASATAIDLLESAALTADVPVDLLKAILNLTKNKWSSLEIYGAKTGLQRDLETALMLAARQVEQVAP
jgi:DNA sulfur modification protein DndC